MRLPSPDADWYVVRCRPRSEHLAAEELRLGGFETYLPQRRIKDFVRRHRKLTDQHVPAMPGYLFVATGRGSAIDWGHLRDDSAFRHVGRVLRGSCGPLRIPASIIIAISVDEMNGKLDEVGAFRKGMAFRIVGGPLRGFMAVTESVTANDRIKALVNLFGRMTTVEFEPSQLEVA